MTPTKVKGKIQLPQTLKLSEYQKVHYIYFYKPQDCQRRKGSCCNVHVTTLYYNLVLAHGFTHDLISLAFITGNSTLKPLLEGLFAQIHIDLS